MASHKSRCGGAGVGRVWHPADSQGLPRAIPRASLAHSTGGEQEMLPPGHRVVGLHCRRDATQLPSCKICRSKPQRVSRPLHGRWARIGRNQP
jgi:hypothetical protein